MLVRHLTLRDAAVLLTICRARQFMAELQCWELEKDEQEKRAFEETRHQRENQDVAIPQNRS